MKTGLVLEGGAMRGIYTAGVLDVFMERKITFDGVIGVSAGAIHGCSYVSGQKGRSIRYYKKYSRNKHFMSFYNLIRTGDIVGRKFCYHDIPERLDPYDYEAFLKSNMDFYVTCSNVKTGRPEYIKIKNMLSQVDLVRASASMPFVSRIVSYDGKLLLDGGCTDSIPVKAFQKMGYNRCVVVLTRDRKYRKKPENTKLLKAMYARYPEFSRAVRERHITYNKTLEEIVKMERNNEIFVIRPSVELTIGRMEHDPEKIQAVYDIGRKDAEKKVAAMKQWLENGK